MDNLELNDEEKFQSALRLHEAGELRQARSLYELLLFSNPGRHDVLANLGLICAQQGDLIEAEKFLRGAIAIEPKEASYLSNYANILQDLNRCDDAVSFYRKAIALDFSYADAYYNLGNALQKLKQYDQAIKSYTEAINLRPQWTEAYINRGNVCGFLGRYDEAHLDYTKAIEASPQFSGGYINRANLLAKFLNQKDAAISDYESAIKLGADSCQTNLIIVQILQSQSRFKEAIEKCQFVISLKPDRSDAYCVMGTNYFQLRDLNLAISSHRKALELDSDNANAHDGLGLALWKAGYHSDARVCFTRALEINPGLNAARVNMADSFLTEGDLQSALIHYSLLPAKIQALGLIQLIKHQLVDWEDYEKDKKLFLRKISQPAEGEFREDPWHMQRISDSAELAKAAAENYFKNYNDVHFKLDPLTKREKTKKIKVAYFSPDFREHPVSHLALEFFGAHTKDKFETYAFSFGKATTNDAMRPRLVEAFDHFIDINRKNDADVVTFARELGIDIAIDLAGITSESRPQIFPNRVAPIQINYLGFAGTLGTNCHDYIIADEVLIPKQNEKYFTEKVARIPCMMPFDTKNHPHLNLPTREAACLPETGFIFCSFNQCFKFNPEIFDSWMRILNKTPGSFLWLSLQRDVAIKNLKKEAAARGVDPERIIFAPRAVGINLHLARMQCADLFLDTFPYNAHTSAMDALWAGVPLITREGDSFASRMGASLLTSIGLTELIVETPEAYENLAIHLAQNPDRLSAIRAKLKENQSTHPLFNMSTYVKKFEEALTRMYDAYHSDLPPESFTISL